MRLDKFLSNATDFSRKDIKRLVRQNLVQVNGEVASDPALHVNDADSVYCDGMLVSAPRPRYFILHKPAGFVSATKDSDHPTVLDLLDEPRPESLQIAGRLDLDTTGLLLITDDGAWNHRLTSPRSSCVKTYCAELAEDIDPATADRFAQGVWLDGEKRRTLPAELRVLSPREVELDIYEGKYHQVKRMFAAIGNRVVALHRSAFGPLRLDADLAPGEYRSLTPAEVMSFEEPLASKEPSAGREPSAKEEPSASRQPSAKEEPSMNNEPSADRKPSASEMNPAITESAAPQAITTQTEAAESSVSMRMPRKRPRG